MELPSLLLRFKTLAPDEFELYFGIYGLDVDVDPAHPGQFHLLRVELDDSRTAMNYAAIRTFFGGSIGADGVVSFETTWAARMRGPPHLPRQQRFPAPAGGVSRS